MADDSRRWTFISGKWHELGALGQVSLCGQLPTSGFTSYTSSEVVQEVRLNKTTVCGRCDKIASTTRRPTSSRTERPTSAPLTPEQQAMRDKEAEQAKQTARLRAAKEADQSSIPADRSVKAMRGGLPGLGKRS